MFGYLKSRPHQLSRVDIGELNVLQCGFCHTLRREYNLWAALLGGWEGRFLALLIHSQSLEKVNFSTTRCPASLWVRQCPIPENEIAASYAAAVVVWLFREKLMDSIRDDRSVLAKLGCRALRGHFDKANVTLRELGAPIQDIKMLCDQQLAIETSKQRFSLDQRLEPFARAVALLTAHTARIAGISDNYDTLYRIGWLMGRLITMMDACHDFERDRRKGSYNIVRATALGGMADKFLTIEQFEWIESALFTNLQSIRTAVEKLILLRHAVVVQNILILGLYDVCRWSIEKLHGSAIRHTLKKRMPHTVCGSCGTSMQSRFCPHCGQIRSTQ